jgi:hypothetical protein
MKVRWFSLLAIAVTLLVLVVAKRGLGVTAQQSVQKGISYATWGSGLYSSPDADLSLTHLAATGADWIGLIVTGYQDNIASTTIFTATVSPTDADLIHAIAQAHSLGLKVMLKPHLDLYNDPTHWRGQIGEEFTTEAEWAAWFTSYRNFIGHYADLAQSYGVDQFCAGNELAGTTHRADDWRTVIAEVRARYGGPLTYAAWHDSEETKITWWDAVDYIGVDALYPLTDKNDPTVDELKAAWTPHITTLANLASTWGKPILLTEIGYRSLDGANRHPWDYWSSGTLDLQEQADCYQATFESVYGQPWFAGMFWWEWGTDPFQGGPCDDGYTPYDKPAEDVLRAWYGAPPRPRPIPLGPDYSQAMDIYGDALGPSWEDWSWDATRDLAATDQVYSGTHAISVTLGAYGALMFWHPGFDSDPYYWLEFYVRGSSLGGQRLTAFCRGEDGTELRRRPVNDCRYIEGGTIEPGTWKRVRIPLSDLNAAGRSLVTIAIQDRSGQGSNAFWVDEIRLVAAVTWRVYLPVVLRNY